MLYDGKNCYLQVTEHGWKTLQFNLYSVTNIPQVSTSKSERVQRRSIKDAACPLDNVQHEIEVISDEVVENIEIDHVVNCVVDSKEVQGTLLC